MALAMMMVMDGAPARAEQQQQQDEHGRGGILFSPTCAQTGTCVDPTCYVGRGRYIVTDALVFDTAYGGRLWQRGVGPQGDFAAAQAYCASLVVQGLKGWRLPTNPEMGTIVLRPLGLGRPDACVPSLDQAAFAFPDPAGPLAFWTSSAQPPQPIRYLRNFSDGRSPRTYEDDPEPWVRCVHDPLF
jgi:hypothetical protein